MLKVEKQLLSSINNQPEKSDSTMANIEEFDVFLDKVDKISE